MGPRAFFASTRVLIVAGKGGVGKTTVSAVLGRVASLAGLSPLIVELEGRSGLAALFTDAGTLDYVEAELVPPDRPHGAGAVRARTLTPDDALIEYLDAHGMRRVSKRLTRAGLVDVVATAVPGIKDILVLGKVKQLERDRVADVIIVDAPAAGHAISFLESAHGMLDAVRAGPIRGQAQEVVEMITDPARTQVVLVTLPEETPVNELVETAFALEDRIGVKLGPVVVNGLYPPLPGLDVDPAEAAAAEGTALAPDLADAMRAAAAFRQEREHLQAAQTARLADALPLPQLRLPYLFAHEVGPEGLEVLAAAMTDEVVRIGATPAPQ
ncbi:MAG TPA: ArsA-related P-loop ATPase [Acidimicrobiales bacterium]|nr:ArsA-related P-loop ATPase [Acidimicrobiales bacterium]